jgi:N6-adenosine-specific RNA methylase IME4
LTSDLTIYEPSSPLDLSSMFTPTSLDLPDGLSFGEWGQIGRSLSKMQGAIHWWIGDWLNYAGKHYGETYTEAEALTGFATGTLKKDMYVSSRVEKLLRSNFLSWNHHYLIAPMEQDRQIHWLRLAEQNNWTVSELRRQIKRQYLIDNTPDLPNGKYRVIYADPPWEYQNDVPDYVTKPSDYYPLMTVSEIAALPIREMAEQDAVLFLWATSPILREVFVVIEEWGFEYKTSFVWDKVKHCMGHYNSVRHEFLLVCTRGGCTPDIRRLFDSVVTEERPAQHSQKPEIFREMIDTLYPYGKRIELFARQPAEGWEVWGNEL